jgi:two-component system response regulator
MIVTRILLVEDNADDVLLLQRAWQKGHLQHELVVARDGQEALDYLFQDGRSVDDRPSLIVLDLNLPRLNGLEVLARVRQDERFRLVPVVVLTSSLEHEDILRSYGLGANSYLRKPVDYQAFVEISRQLTQYWLQLNVSPTVVNTPVSHSASD